MSGETRAAPPGSDGFDADAYLNSLEPIGWKLGLERMELLSERLGRPQDSFATIHVVGTNGKSSVSRMIAAICEAHGYRAGCSLSPHLARWSERVLVAGDEVPGLFASCVRRAARAASEVNEALPEGEVTQFEVATAAAFLTLAEAGVQVAAIEAGLGGRLDATNSIDSLATVLTSIGLDHTEYLGDTELEIAAEKLAVLRPGTTLVLGALSSEVRKLARETASDRGCEIREPGDTPAADTGLAGFQQRNLAVAEAAAGVFLGEVSAAKVREAASGLVVPGRLELIEEDPPVFVDVAHNPAGARALAESIPELVGTVPVVGVVGVLSDKDAPGMLAELSGTFAMVVLTPLPAEAIAAWGRPGASAWPVGRLKRIAEKLALPADVAGSPAEALDAARTLAGARGGAVVVTGSHFLLAPEDSLGGTA